MAENTQIRFGVLSNGKNVATSRSLPPRTVKQVREVGAITRYLREQFPQIGDKVSLFGTHLHEQVMATLGGDDVAPVRVPLVEVKRFVGMKTGIACLNGYSKAKFKGRYVFALATEAELAVRGAELKAERAAKIAAGKAVVAKAARGGNVLDMTESAAKLKKAS